MVRRSALVAVLVLSAAACSAEAEDVNPAPSSLSTTSAVPLTVIQARKAALVVSDLPKGWGGGAAIDPTPTPGFRGQYDPPECLVFRHPMDLLGKPATAVVGQYVTREPSQSITERIWSWPTRLDSFVVDITDRLATCKSYTMEAEDHQKYRWVANRLPVRGLADGITLRYDTSTAADGVLLSGVYVAYVVRGGTVLSLEVQGDTISDALFTQIVSKAASRLDAVIG